MIIFSDYHKAYGSHEVLLIPDLTIPAGIHWIKGVNGSGKSTLLKYISGIIPYKGQVQINGHDLRRNPVLSRKLVKYGNAESMYPDFLRIRRL